MNPIGNIPSPYGVLIPVYFDRTKAANEDDCYFHDIDGAMSLAGVYGMENRQRCKADVDKASKSGSVIFSLFEKHGGHKIPRRPLIRPSEPVYPSLPPGDAFNLPTENWVTLTLDQLDWTKRAAVLLDLIGGNMEAAKDWDLPKELQALALAQLLTASLEHLTESEIDCLEAAAIYTLTLHYDAWSSSAIDWLRPFRETWLRDWIAERPVYREFAQRMVKINDALPDWLWGAPK